MDKEHVKGAADKAKGTMKDAAGKMTGERNWSSRENSTKRKARPTRASATPRTPFEEQPNEHPQRHLPQELWLIFHVSEPRGHSLGRGSFSLSIRRR
jgi:hypothetical protein